MLQAAMMMEIYGWKVFPLEIFHEVLNNKRNEAGENEDKKENQYVTLHVCVFWLSMLCFYWAQAERQIMEIFGFHSSAITSQDVGCCCCCFLINFYPANVMIAYIELERKQAGRRASKN